MTDSDTLTPEEIAHLDATSDELYGHLLKTLHRRLRRSAKYGPVVGRVREDPKLQAIVTRALAHVLILGLPPEHRQAADHTGIALGARIYETQVLPALQQILSRVVDANGQRVALPSEPVPE